MRYGVELRQHVALPNAADSLAYRADQLQFLAEVRQARTELTRRLYLHLLASIADKHPMLADKGYKTNLRRLFLTIKIRTAYHAL